MSRSPLDHSPTAEFAWNRFRRIMRWWGLAAAVIVITVLIGLWRSNGFISIHLYIAAALGIGGMVMLTGALMSLLFLSSGTGHDEAVRDFEADNFEADRGESNPLDKWLTGVQPVRGGRDSEPR